jgi:hypothetical protein
MPVLTPVPKGLLTYSVLNLAFITIHHVFRLGNPFLLWGAIALLLTVQLFFWSRARPLGAGLGFASLQLAALSISLFDGVLDHVLKALGLAHLGLLPGSQEEIVPTLFQLADDVWTQGFYEQTGILEGVFGAATFVSLAAWLIRGFRSRA